MDDTSVDDNIHLIPLPNEEPTPVNLTVDSNLSSIVAESNLMDWVQIYPVTLTTKLVYCFKYLTPIGEYSEVCDLFNVVYNGIFKFKFVSSL